MLRMIDQGVPPWRKAVCGEPGAVMGPAFETLGALNLRMFELGRLCRASPSTPGQATGVLYSHALACGVLCLRKRKSVVRTNVLGKPSIPLMSYPSAEWSSSSALDTFPTVCLHSRGAGDKDRTYVAALCAGVPPRVGKPPATSRVGQLG